MEKEKNNSSKRIRIRNGFLFLLGFLGIGAIGGGLVLIIDPSGELLGLPSNAFKNMPFDDFLIPGIILFTVLGIIPSLLIIALLKKPACKLAEEINIFKDMHWSWTYSIYIAFALIAWIYIQLIFLKGAAHFLHNFYMCYAILIFILALLPQMRYLYKKNNSPLV
jgi:hypothetical protein